MFTPQWWKYLDICVLAVSYIYISAFGVETTSLEHRKYISACLLLRCWWYLSENIDRKLSLWSQFGVVWNNWKMDEYIINYVTVAKKTEEELRERELKK